MNDGFKQLHSKFQEATNQLALALEDNEQLNRSISELPKLRDEVARLRKDSRDLAQIKADNQSDPTQVAMKSWLARVTQLKQRFEERPEHNIPELQLVGERDWLDAAHGKLETEEDYRRAMSRLRSIAENKVANLLHPALRKYLAANEGNFPTDLSQLQPYFKSPVDAVVLQRYDIFPASEVPNVGVGNWIITQKAPIDIDYDSRWVVGANGTGSSGSAWKEDKTLPPAIAALKSAMNEYKQAHDGKEPLDPLQLKPFLKTPEQEKALEKILQSLAAMKAKENED